jgi:hypothetical protein
MTTDLDPDVYPYFFECGRCGESTTIEHEDATDAVPPGINATPRQANERALRNRDWGRVAGRLRCGDCLRAA